MSMGWTDEWCGCSSMIKFQFESIEISLISSNDFQCIQYIAHTAHTNSQRETLEIIIMTTRPSWPHHTSTSLALLCGTTPFCDCATYAFDVHLASLFSFGRRRRRCCRCINSSQFWRFSVFPFGLGSAFNHMKSAVYPFAMRLKQKSKRHDVCHFGAMALRIVRHIISRNVYYVCHLIFQHSASSTQRTERKWIFTLDFAYLFWCCHFCFSLFRYNIATAGCQLPVAITHRKSYLRAGAVRVMIQIAIVMTHERFNLASMRRINSFSTFVRRADDIFSECQRDL